MHTKPIRVLHVIARMNVGGTAKYLVDLLPKLSSENFEILLAVGRVQIGEVEDSGLKDLNFTRVEDLGRRINLVDDLRAFLALRRVVKEFRPEIIHSHTFKAGLLARLMFFKIPKVHTFHGHLMTDPEFSKLARRTIIIIERFLAKFTNRFIVTGEEVASDLLSFHIGSKDKYLSIPGELRIKSLHPRLDARKSLGIENSFTILWLARVAPVKQPRLFVEVARLCPEFTFVMCGDGSELEDIMLIAPSNLKIMGMVDPAEYLAAADVFVSTSANEGIPYSILEAQAAGIPVVAVDRGAISELIEDGVNGFLTNNEAEEIAFRIVELSRDVKLRAKFGETALAKSRLRSLEPKMLKLHGEIYSEVMGN